MPARLQTQAVAQFVCLGDACPDTCCKGWGMQLTQATVDKYTAEAPELLDAVSSGEAEFIMKRDPVSDYCIKFDAGWCGIHRSHGEDFLGDACHFFPRITRALGDVVLTSAALSCPETARRMLFEVDALANTPRTEIRQPYSLRDYLPQGMAPEEALAVHQAFLDAAADENFSAEMNCLRISTVAQALMLQPVNAWLGASAFYCRMAESRVPAAEPSATDPAYLLHALVGLVAASKGANTRVKALIARMAAMLDVSFTEDARALVRGDDAEGAALNVITHSVAQAARLQPVLRRYVMAQLSQALFPFAGFGTTLADRAAIIGVRLATVKLALATLPEVPSEEAIVEVVQTLSRFTDHLADPTLSLRIYQETGWLRDARLRGLLQA